MQGTNPTPNQQFGEYLFRTGVGHYLPQHYMVYEFFEQFNQNRASDPDMPYLQTALKTLVSVSAQEIQGKVFGITNRTINTATAGIWFLSGICGKAAEVYGVTEKIDTMTKEVYAKWNPGNRDGLNKSITEYAALYGEHLYSDLDFSVLDRHLKGLDEGTRAIINQVPQDDLLKIYNKLRHDTFTCAYQIETTGRPFGDYVGYTVADSVAKTAKAWEDALSTFGEKCKEITESWHIPTLPIGFADINLLQEMKSFGKRIEEASSVNEIVSAVGYFRSTISEWDAQFSGVKNVVDGLEGIAGTSVDKEEYERLEKTVATCEERICKLEQNLREYEENGRREPPDAVSVVCGMIDAFATVVAVVQEDARWRQQVAFEQEKIERALSHFGFPLNLTVQLDFSPTADPEKVFRTIQKNIAEQCRNHVSSWLKNWVAIRGCFQRNVTRRGYHNTQIIRLQKEADITKSSLQSILNKMENLSESSLLFSLAQIGSVLSGVACSLAIFNPALLPALTGVNTGVNTITKLAGMPRQRKLADLQSEANRKADKLNQLSLEIAYHTDFKIQINDRLGTLANYLQENLGIVSPKELIKHFVDQRQALIDSEKDKYDRIEQLKKEIASGERLGYDTKGAKRRLKELEDSLEHTEEIVEINFRIQLTKDTSGPLAVLNQLMQAGNDQSYAAFRNWYNTKGIDGKIDLPDLLVKGESLFKKYYGQESRWAHRVEKIHEQFREKENENFSTESQFAKEFAEWLKENGVEVEPGELEALYSHYKQELLKTESHKIDVAIFEKVLKNHEGSWGAYNALYQGSSLLLRTALQRRLIALNPIDEKKVLDFIDVTDQLVLLANQGSILYETYSEYRKTSSAIESIDKIIALGPFVIIPQFFAAATAVVMILGVLKNWGTIPPTEVGQLRQLVEFLMSKLERDFHGLHEDLFHLTLKLDRLERQLNYVSRVVERIELNQHVNTIELHSKDLRKIRDKMAELTIVNGADFLERIYLPKINSRTDVELSRDQLDLIASSSTGLLAQQPTLYLNYLSEVCQMECAKKIPHIPLLLVASHTVKRLGQSELRTTIEQNCEKTMIFFKELKELKWVDVFNKELSGLFSSFDTQQADFNRFFENRRAAYFQRAAKYMEVQFNRKIPYDQHKLYSSCDKSMKAVLDHLSSKEEYVLLTQPIKIPQLKIDKGLLVASKNPQEELPLILPSTYLEGFVQRFVKKYHKYAFLLDRNAKLIYKYAIREEGKDLLITLHFYHVSTTSVDEIFASDAITIPNSEQKTPATPFANYQEIFDLLYNAPRDSYSNRNVYANLQKAGGFHYNHKYHPYLTSAKGAELEIDTLKKDLLVSTTVPLSHLNDNFQCKDFHIAPTVLKIFQEFEDFQEDQNKNPQVLSIRFFEYYNRWYERFTAMVTIYCGMQYAECAAELAKVGVTHPKVLEGSFLTNPKDCYEKLIDLKNRVNEGALNSENEDVESFNKFLKEMNIEEPLYQEAFRRALEATMLPGKTGAEQTLRYFNYFLTPLYAQRNVTPTVHKLFSFSSFKKNRSETVLTFYDAAFKRQFLTEEALFLKLRVPDHVPFGEFRVKALSREFLKESVKLYNRSIVILKPGANGLELALFVHEVVSRRPYFLFWDDADNTFDLFEKNPNQEAVYAKLCALPAITKEVIRV